MEKKTVYVETSIVSYLTARTSSNLIAAAWQKATVDWRDTRRGQFSVYVSDIVLMEAGRGDSTAAARRVAALADIPVLEINDAAVALSKALMAQGAVSGNALDDALHIAVSAVHGVDYLLTWNCRHIDNAETKPVIRSVCAAQQPILKFAHLRS